MVTLPPSHQLAAERLDLTGTFRIFWFNPPLLQRRKHPKPRRKAPCVNICIPTQGYRYLALFRKLSKGWSLGLAEQMSSLVMWPSSSSELFCPAQHWSPTHLHRAVLCQSISWARTSASSLIKDPAPVAHPWPLGSCCGGWSAPLLKRNLWAYRPEFSFLRNQIIEQKQMPALCVFLSFFFFLVGGWCSGRIDVGDTVRDAAKTIRSPLKEARANASIQSGSQDLGSSNTSPALI